VIIAAAQRLVVEHAYTFEEEIPGEVFLEELALLFQEYTMKPGSRPFGCCLLVACLGEGGGGKMVRIDPSGAVTELESTVYLGRGDGDRIVRRVEEEIVGGGVVSSDNCERADDGDDDVNSLDEAERVLLKILGEEMGLVVDNGESMDGEGGG